MQKSNAPTKLTIVFASGTGAGPVNVVPLTPGATSGTASYQTGFTSVNMEPIASGGVPPFGADFNGLFQDATKARIWQQAGYMYPFDSTFAGNLNIGGYPAGSVLMMASGKGIWLNQSDNNSVNPDMTGSSGWLGIAAAGTSTINTTGGTVTPDPSVLGVTTLLIAGTLTANASVVLPLTAGTKWIVVNNTTGSFTVTVQGATGTGVQVAQGASNAAYVFTDGTNFYATSANVSGLYLPINGNAVSASKLVNARTIAMSGDVVWSVSFDGSANVTAAGTIQAGAVSLSKMANLTANTLLGNPAASAATPQAITLANGLQFSGTTLGMGAITPSSVTSTGGISGTTGSFTGSLTAAGITSSNSLTVNAGSVTFGSSSTSMSVTVQNSGLGSGLGSFWVPFTIASTDSNNDQLITQLNRGVAGTSWTNVYWSIYRKVDATPQGYLQIGDSAGNAVVSIGYGSSPYVIFGPSLVTATMPIGVNNHASAYASQGGYIAWNQSASSGEMDFINNQGGWSGGFTWYNTSGGGTSLTQVMSISAGGNLTTAGTIQPGSDSRVKANPQKIENALAFVETYLIGCTYHRRDQNGVMQAGFIADAVQAGASHLVTESEIPVNGYERFKTLDYNGAEAYLANAITELHALVREQARELAILRTH